MSSIINNIKSSINNKLAAIEEHIIDVKNVKLSIIAVTIDDHFSSLRNGVDITREIMLDIESKRAYQDALQQDQEKECQEQALCAIQMINRSSERILNDLKETETDFIKNIKDDIEIFTQSIKNKNGDLKTLLICWKNRLHITYQKMRIVVLSII